MLTALLAFLTASSTAHAATLSVPSDFGLLADAVTAAAAGDTIIVEPGLHPIFAPIVITKNLTIRGFAPPREIDDVDIVDDSVLYVDVLSTTFTPGFIGAFVINSNRTLTFENIRFKIAEVHCNDDIDNDGNGFADDQDPLCAPAYDTADPQPTVGPFFFDFRAFYARSGSNLNIVASEFEGFSVGVEAGVLYADNANLISIRDSRFISNRGGFLMSVNGGYTRSRGGALFGVGVTTFEVVDSYFRTNGHRYGGAIYVNDGTNLVLDGNEFFENFAEDGGAVYVESSQLDARRNFFVANTADSSPGAPLLVEYEGGAIYAEYSDVTVQNNVFLSNGALDWAGAIMLRGNQGGITPLIENNTFVSNLPALVGGAAIMVDSSQLEFRNNIAFDELAGVIGSQNWAIGSVPIVEYNDFFSEGAQPGSNVFVGQLAGLRVNTSVNLFQDPLFAYYPTAIHDEWRIWSFWLDPASPAVDSGDPDILDVGGSRSDMGAFGGQSAGAEDADGDGWVNIYDCDDANPNVYPYAEDICDNADNDCNGIVDDNERTFYIDRDFDGYGNADDNQYPPEELCPGEQPSTIPVGEGVWVTLAGDCRPANALVSPGRVEFCDGEDNDCDLQIDEGIPVRTYFPDFDGDGFGAPSAGINELQADCPPSDFYSPFADDCDDTKPGVHPLITIDRQIHRPLALRALERNEADRAPGLLTNVADGIDQDCDGVDLCYPDMDSDRYGEAPDAISGQRFMLDDDMNCRNLSTFTSANNLDCDDRDASSNPRGTEVAGDGLDQDCNGFDDCFEDLDGDGYGSPRVVVATVDLCGQNGTASEPGDCDDASALAASINPLAAETCDGFDNDCDGTIDEVNDGTASEFYLDFDGDGYGDLTKSISACGSPLGYATRAGDCDDANPDAYPLNDEVCDGVDNNCANGIDEGAAVDADNWYIDVDNDSFGSNSTVEKACDRPDGGPWVKGGRELDCDDSDALIGPCCQGCSATAGSRSVAPMVLALLVGAGFRRRRPIAA